MNLLEPNTEVLQVIYIGVVVGWQYTINAGLQESSAVLDQKDGALFSKVSPHGSDGSVVPRLRIVGSFGDAAPRSGYYKLREAIFSVPHGTCSASVSQVENGSLCHGGSLDRVRIVCRVFSMRHSHWIEPRTPTLWQ